MSRVKIYFDGGCRPNPGAMEIAVVVAGQAHIERDLGQGGSMEAEWLALHAALRIAAARGLRDPVLLGDSIAVIGQATGAVQCRGANLAQLALFHDLAAAVGTPRVRYVKRAQNLAGIALSRWHAR